jgi:hypothetical protein
MDCSNCFCLNGEVAHEKVCDLTPEDCTEVCGLKNKLITWRSLAILLLFSLLIGLHRPT